MNTRTGRRRAMKMGKNPPLAALTCSNCGKPLKGTGHTPQGDCLAACGGRSPELGAEIAARIAKPTCSACGSTLPKELLAYIQQQAPATDGYEDRITELQAANTREVVARHAAEKERDEAQEWSKFHHCKPPLGNPTREEAIAERDEMRSAARSLLDRLTQIAESSRGAYQMAAIHGYPYAGPTWEEPAKALAELLAKEG